MKLDSHWSADNNVICNFCAKFFSSTYSSSALYINNQNKIAEEKTFDVSHIDQRTISKYIQELKSSHVAGPNGVPSTILKHHSKLFSTPLTYLFNK